MQIHINTTKGDYIFNEWDEHGFEQVDAKRKELESLGYNLMKKAHDYLNEYFIYKNKENDQKIITFCRL